MERLASTMVQQIVRPMSAFQERRADSLPYSVTIDLGDDTLVITLNEDCLTAEKAQPKSGADAARMQEIYRQFISDAMASLRQHMHNLADENVPETAQVFPHTRSGRPNGWRSRDPVGRRRI